jgi:dTDP-4-dehydrorhamnose reductase
MAKILLLGSTGLLGGAFLRLLRKTDYAVLAPTRTELDLSKEKEILGFISQHRDVDFVINCSGYNFVDKAEKNKKENDFCIWLNAEVPRIIADYYACLGASTKLFQFSSDYVFDGKKNAEYVETDQKNPLSVYGHSKSLGEDNLLKANPNNIIIRTSWLFGEEKVNFLSKIIDKANSGEYLEIVSDQYGKPTYTRDLASYVIENLSRFDNGIYHLSNETILSWYDFAKFGLGLIKNEFKINKVLSNHFKVIAERPKYSALKNTRLIKLRSGKEAITDYINKLSL